MPVDKCIYSLLKLVHLRRPPEALLQVALQAGLHCLLPAEMGCRMPGIVPGALCFIPVRLGQLQTSLPQLVQTRMEYQSLVQRKPCHVPRLDVQRWVHLGKQQSCELRVQISQQCRQRLLFPLHGKEAGATVVEEKSLL
ncbi:hypothetical protein D3C75_774630 [compost metagenome]